MDRTLTGPGLVGAGIRTIANVALIPCSTDYRNANLTEDLWYSQDDLDLFKKIRIEEILKERQELQDPKYATL